MENKISFKFQIKNAWAHAWAFKSFRIQAIITLLCIISFSVIFYRFFEFVESRDGMKLNDYILTFLPAADVSWVVFAFLYSGIVFGIYFHLSHPKTILIIFQAYVIVTLLRVLTITLIPLEPPAGYIPLREPVVQLFTAGGKIISKDLFFSGHMSTILTLLFSTHRKNVKAFLLLSSIMIGSMVLIQHVHYTIDVIAAIPATYLVYFISKKYLAGKSY